MHILASQYKSTYNSNQTSPKSSKKKLNIYTYILYKTAHIHMLHQVELCSNDVLISAM